jgi:hypothetical protein
MEIINNDKIYQLTKNFIQNKINLDIFSDTSKDLLISYYNTITPENAQEIYEKVTTLYRTELNKMHWEVSCMFWRYSSIGFLISGVSYGISHVGLKYHPNNSTFENINVLGAIGMIVSGIAFFSAGFNY